jgi:hypothetical protein
VTLERADGSRVEVVPFALADLNDGDNDHDRGPDTPGTPVLVSPPAGFPADPDGDPNPETRVEVSRRR